VELVNGATGERSGFDLDAIGPRRGAWIDYAAGTAWALGEAGIQMHGLRGVIVSSLPTGSGLSSSAALELAAAWALADLPGGGIPALQLARICQRAENVHVGVNCGLMDQFASACGADGAAILLDCRSLEHREVALPLATHTLVALHSGSPRSLSASQYNARRAQCDAAVAALARQDPTIVSLRDVTPAMLPRIASLVDDSTFRRCRHVLTENVRVGATLAALDSGDLAPVGAHFTASHASLRDDYEVSSPELDALVEIASAVRGVTAARMTGAGFGGCTINLVERDAVESLRAAVLEQYPARTALTSRGPRRRRGGRRGGTRRLNRLIGASRGRSHVRVQVARDHVILVFGRQLAEVAAPAPDPDDQVAVLLRMCPRVQELLRIEGIELQLLAAEAGERAYQQGDLADRFGVGEDRGG
jgi:galactokinase